MSTLELSSCEDFSLDRDEPLYLYLPKLLEILLFS